LREGEEADNEMVPSETEGEGVGQQKRTTASGEELWAAAPKGFLSNLSAQEIQVCPRFLSTLSERARRKGS